MDHIKIQSEILKAIDADRRRLYQIIDDHICVTCDGCAVAYLIPQCEFYIDLNRMTETYIFARFLEESDDLVEVKLTNNMKKVRKTTVVMLSDEDGHHTWVDEKLIKTFGKCTRFKVHKACHLTGAVHVYSNALIPLGVLMPMRIEEGE